MIHADFRNFPSVSMQDRVENNSVDAMNLKEWKSIYISRPETSFSSK